MRDANAWEPGGVEASAAQLQHSLEVGVVGGQRFSFDHAGFHQAYASFLQAFEAVKAEREKVQFGLGACYMFRVTGVAVATSQADGALINSTGSATRQLRGLESELALFVNNLREAYTHYLQTDDDSRLRLVAAAAPRAGSPNAPKAT